MPERVFVPSHSTAGAPLVETQSAQQREAAVTRPCDARHRQRMRSSAYFSLLEVSLEGEVSVLVAPGLLPDEEEEAAPSPLEVLVGGAFLA
jgi:hypothetical protein